MKKFIPNFITTMNLLSGSLAIFFAFSKNENLYVASFFVIIATVFDFFDGFFARLLKATSDFGKQLDSLSDMVSFGLAPAFIMLNFMQKNTNADILPFVALLIIPFSAYRLAYFNISDQKYEFSGLPTPALAIVVASIPLALKFNFGILHINYIYTLYENIFFLVAITLILSALLVLPLKLPALKFKNFSFRDNKEKYIFLLLSFLLIVLFGFYAFLFIILFYLFLAMLL